MQWDLFWSGWAMRLWCALVGAALFATVSGPAGAIGPVWMQQAEIRSQMIGHVMKGYYRSGERWVDDYAADGGIKYTDQHNTWTGRWSFQEAVFCTYYNDGVDGGCYMVRQVSRNCFEYVIVPNAWSGKELPPEASDAWFARGWRDRDPSSCEGIPVS